MAYFPLIRKSSVIAMSYDAGPYDQNSLGASLSSDNEAKVTYFEKPKSSLIALETGSQWHIL